MTNDQIADLLIALKNAVNSKQEKLLVPYSGFKKRILDLMVSEKLLDKVKVTQKSQRQMLEIRPAYEEQISLIENIKKVSLPGKRVYRKYRQLLPYVRKHELVIISSPKGIITGKEAIKIGSGGEVICWIN